MTILRKVKTVECACGYIATFETGEFRCPDCGRIHFLWSDRTIDPKCDVCTETRDEVCSPCYLKMKGIGGGDV